MLIVVSPPTITTGKSNTVTKSVLIKVSTPQVFEAVDTTEKVPADG